MESPLRIRLPFHYGWVIVFAGMLTIVSCLGFGRFALGMLLPAMGASLDLSYSQMGLIGTGNFVGYLVAVVAAGTLGARLGLRKLVSIGLFMVAGSLMLVGLARDFTEIFLLYVVTGLGSGAANVPVMGLVSHWFSRRYRGRAAGFVVSGSGFGLIISGTLIPVINRTMGAEGWRTGWLVLGVLSLMVAVVGTALLRNRPSDMGLAPVGEEAVSEKGSPPPKAAPAPSLAALKGTLIHLGAIYFLFGYTYVIYATFIVTTLVQERGFSETVAGVFWAWVGVLSLFSGPVFGTLSDRLGRRAGLMIVFSLQAVAYLLVALPLPESFLYLSVGLFGLVAWSVPSIMTAAVGDYMGAERAVTALGLITFFFGVGQIIGPAIAGTIADLWGGFAPSFHMAAFMAAAAVVLTHFLKRPPAGH